jgi:hypothetical protein
VKATDHKMAIFTLEHESHYLTKAIARATRFTLIQRAA